MVVDDSVGHARPDLALDRRRARHGRSSASLRTGREAVDQLERINPDVVVLDIEMPELDGISALPQLLAKKRDLVIIMASTLTRRNAEISFKALSLGAADYIPKPESTREVAAADTFQHDLIAEDPSSRRAGARAMTSPRHDAGARRRLPRAAPRGCTGPSSPCISRRAGAARSRGRSRPRRRACC